MANKSFLAIILVLALATAACRINIDLPAVNIETGPTQEEEIVVPLPDAESADVEIAFGAGQLELSSGAEESLIEGTARYNADELKPEIDIQDGNVRLQTGDLDFDGIPSFGGSVENRWDLQLAPYPMDLRIRAGAYQGRMDLGGLALNNLEVNDGAADVELEFSQPNQAEMEEFRYETGASNVELSGLGNANFETMIFRSGAGNYVLDFSGDLQRDAAIEIESGISQVTIVVPEGVQAAVHFSGGLSNVDAEGDWEREGNDYTHPGEGPVLTFNADMGAGNLELRTR